MSRLNFLSLAMLFVLPVVVATTSLYDLKERIQVLEADVQMLVELGGYSELIAK